MDPQFSNNGVIRGFKTIDLGQGQTPEIFQPTNFSLTELRQRVQDIRDNYDPDFLDSLIVQVLSHIQNHNNPHQVTLAETGADVVSLVYQAWLAAGNTGTLQDFYNVFFQVPIVSTADNVATATGTDLISVSGVETLIATHNTDPNAHTDLLNMILPGTPPSSVPSLAIDAQIGAIANCTVARSTSLTCIDPNGNLITYGPNQLAVDYALGYASLPLYEARTNLTYPSNPLQAVNNSILNAASSNSPILTLKTGPDGNACLVLTENNTINIHGYSFPVSVTSGVEYISSVFVYPLQTTGSLVLYLDTNTMLFLNLTTLDVSTSSDAIQGYAQCFPNGWIRLGLQYVAAATETASITIAQTQLTELGVNLAYQGTTQPLFGLFGLQHVVGYGLSPYIPTTNAPASHDNTVIQLTTTLAVVANGLLSISHHHAESALASNRVIISLANALTISVNAEMIETIISNADNTTSTLTLPDVTDMCCVSSTSFSPTQYLFGSTGSAKISTTGDIINLVAGTNTITLSSSAAPFNGNISAMVLYPIADTDMTIEFLIGEVIS